MSESPKLKICVNFPLESKWDPATWPATDVPPDSKINKRTLKNKYFLEKEHLVDLKFERRRLEGYYFEHLYVEREVERRAWQVFGGPTGLRARQTHQNGFRTKWRNGVLAEECTDIAAVSQKCVTTTRQPTMPIVDIDLTQTAFVPKPKRMKPRDGCSNGDRITCQQTMVAVDIDLTQAPRVPKPTQLRPRAGGSKRDIIVLSDDEDLDSGFLSNNRLPHLCSFPTISASSPRPMQGKKRCWPGWEDVIELSSDEDRQELPEKKARKSI